MPQRPYSWLSSKLEVKETSKYGRGVFANDNIKKGDVLIVMGGYICHTDQENKLGEFATRYNMDISEDWSFSPTKKSDLEMMPQHIVNHSCEPNTGFRDTCFMLAIRDILPNEEIVYDYAFVMWSSKDSAHHYKMDCLCQTPLCRKIITENDWKIPSLQLKYGEYFQPFLRRKFQK